MTQVRYTICNQEEKRKKLLVFKLDGLQKHVGCYKATFAWLGVVVDEFYMSLFNQHLKNEWQYATFHGQASMVQQIAKPCRKQEKIHVVHHNLPSIETKANYDKFQRL